MTTDTQTTDESPAIEPADVFYPESSETEAEPTETEPTAEVTPEEEPEPEVEETLEESTEETEESGETKETEEPEYSNEELFVELNGKEHSLKEINEWRLSGLRQSDYTKKTQEHADNVRAFEADKQQQIDTAVSDKYAEIIGTLDALILEADTDQYGEAINWTELRKDDIEEYDRLKAIKDKRLSAVDAVKEKNVQVSNDDIKAKADSELSKLAEMHPQWSKDGKNTEAYDKDMEMVKDQLDKADVPADVRGGMLITGYGEWIIDACRWRQSQEKVAETKKKVVKIPIVTRPKKTDQSKPKSAEEIFYPTSKQG